MMEVISSLKSKNINLEEGSRPSQRPRQGTGSSEVKNADTRKAAQAPPPVDTEKVEALAKELNQTLRQIDGNFSVSVDKATGMMVVRITDSNTGEVVKQVPPQQILDACVCMEKIIGLLINDQA